MYLVNYHSHSLCSMDAEHSMTEMAEAAIAAGLSELCFTDHCDGLDIDGNLNNDFSWEPVWEQFDAAKAAVGDRIKLKLGLELGEAVQNPDFADRVLSQQRPDTDFIIASIHNPPMATDFYFQKFESREQCMEQLDAYVDEMLATVRLRSFDVLGHLTYPLRYMRAKYGFDVDFTPFYGQLRDVFRMLAMRGKGIELNTSGYRNNGGVPMPSAEILRLYKDCGGEIVTLGADSHEPEHIASGLSEGYQLLRELGFTYFCTYTEHEPEFIKL